MDDRFPPTYTEVAMQRMLYCALAALAALPVLPNLAWAQRAAFTNGYLEWGLRPDVPRVPYDGAPYSEKYIASIYNTTPLMLGADPRRLWYMYYQDKIDRAERFGYPLPAGIAEVEAPPNPPRRPILDWLHRR
jgi:hypothetical protein